MKKLLVGLSITLLAIMTAACSPTQTANPETIIKSFYESINRQDVDAATALVADDATFTVLGAFKGVKSGKTEIGSWIQNQVEALGTYEVSDIKVTGETVTYTFKLSREGSQHAEGTATAIVQDGKIKSLQEQ
jgi:ketosteroid isomerase-like protein